MADQLRKYRKGYGPERVIASGTFTTAGTGQPTTANLYGIASITRTGVGVFLVTLLDSAKEYLVGLTTQCTPALSVNAPVVSALSLANKTVTVSICTAGAVAETTGITVHVEVSSRQTN